MDHRRQIQTSSDGTKRSVPGAQQSPAARRKRSREFTDDPSRAKTVSHPPMLEGSQASNSKAPSSQMSPPGRPVQDLKSKPRPWGRQKQQHQPEQQQQEPHRHQNQLHSLPQAPKVAIPRLPRDPESALPPGPMREGFDKTRVSHACEPCRTRKSKCSGERPVCTHCKEYKLRCIYADGKRDRAKR